MLNQVKKNLFRPAIFWLLLFVVTTFLQAGEQIQFSERSTKVEIPKPTFKRENDDALSSKDDPGPSGLGPLTPPPAMAPSRAMTRKYEEYLDKKQNWILNKPEDFNKTTKSDEAMGVRDMDLESFDKKPKRGMERFFESTTNDRKAQSTNPNGSRNNSEDSDNNRQFDFGNSPQNALGMENDPNAPANGNANGAATDGIADLNLNNFIRPQQFEGFAPKNGGLTRQRFEGFSAGRADTEPNKALREREDQQHSADFQKLLSSPGSATIGPRDPINLISERSQPEANPTGPRRFDQAGGVAQRDALSPFGQGVNAAIRPSSPGGLDSFASRGPSLPGIGSSFNPAPTPSFRAPSQPAVLEIPKRR